MAFGDPGCKLMVLLLQFFSWMAERISLSTNKALLTVLPALHSLPWAYDSRPSDYHLNISFLQGAGRCSWRCCWASSSLRARSRAVVAHRRPVGHVRRCCPTNPSRDNHPGRWAALFCLDLSCRFYRSIQDKLLHVRQRPFAYLVKGFGWDGWTLYVVKTHALKRKKVRNYWLCW